MMKFRKILPVLYILVIVMALAVPALSDNLPRLIITKSITDINIPLNGVTEVKIQVKNMGGGEAKNITIDDKVRQGFDIISSKKPPFYIPFLKSGESVNLNYTIKATMENAGEYWTGEAAIATFQDVSGTIHSNSSSPVIINVGQMPKNQIPGFEGVLSGIGILIALVFLRK